MLKPAAALICLLVAAFAGSVSAAPALKPPLKPAVASFLKELGLDPGAKDILSIAGDKVTAKSGKIYSLDSLAAKRDENGVKAFIATRVFLHAFQKNPETEFPDDELYNILYLNGPEKTFIAEKLKESFPKPNRSP